MFYTEVPKNVFAKFLYYSALSFPFDFYSTKTALPSMTQQDLGNHPVALPPMDEQKVIVQFIEEESRLIDQAISRAQREIELMREYRNRMISDVVTGKIDIRGIDVPEVAEEELQVLDEGAPETDEVINDEGDIEAEE
jgi:type I restriction enzyme, S subunit